MKNERKPKTPRIAAHPVKKNGQKPARPDGKDQPARRSRASKPGAASLDISTLPHQNPGPVLRFTQDGDLLFQNAAAASLLAFSIGQEIPADWREIIRSTFESGTNREMEFEQAGRSFSAMLVPVREHQHVNVYCRDITDRKQIEEMFKVRDLELHAVVDQTPFMLTRCTRDLRYRFVSRAYAEMLGRKPEEITGKPIVEVLGAEGLKTLQPYIDQALAGERVEYETELPLPDGNTPTLHVVYTPDLDGQGQVIGWLASIVDVSIRKAAEEERIQFLKREQAQIDRAQRAWQVAEEAKLKAEQELWERQQAEAALGMWADSPLPLESRPIRIRYGMAFVATVVAIILRTLLDPILGDSVQYSLLLSACAFSIWYGGLGPALFSLLVGYLGITWLVLDWRNILDPSVTSFASLMIFLFSSVIVMSLGTAVGRAQRHAHQSAGVAVKRQQQAEFRLVEQRRAEAALRESEQRFRGIFEAAGVSVWVEDFREVKTAIEKLRAEGVTDFRAYFDSHPEFVQRAIELVRVLDVNQETLDLYGASSKDELLGSLNKIFVPETEAAFVEELVTLADGRQMFRSETQAKTLDGRPIFFIFTIHFGPPTSDYSRVIVTITDITERRQMEQSLRVSEEKYRRMVETAHEGIWEIDSQTCTTFVNQHMAAMLGYDVDEMMGRSSFDFVFPEDNAEGEVRLAHARRGGPAKSDEFKFRRKDGSALWALVSSSPQLDEQGNFLGSVAMMVDITERKQIEQELARERELFKRLFETMPVMSSIYEPETGTMRLNAELEKLTGWKADEVTIASLLEGLYPDPQYLQDVLGRMAAAAGTNEWVDVKIHTRDGRVLDTLWANISMMDGEQIITGISLGIDITQRKQTEMALRRRARQQQAVAELGELALREHDLQAVFDRATATVAQTLEVEYCKVLELLEGGESLLLRAGVGWQDGLVGRASVDTGLNSQAGFTLQANGPIVVDDLRDEQRFHGPSLLLDHGVVSGMSCVIHALDGSSWGVLGTHSTRRVAFTQEDVNFLVAVANILSQAIHREKTEEALRQSAEYNAYRVELADALRPYTDPQKIRAEAMRLLSEHLQVDRAIYSEIDDDGAIMIRDNYVKDGVPSLTGRSPLDMFGKARQLLGAGQNLVITDTNTAPDMEEQDRQVFAALGVRSVMGTSLIKEGRWAATLGVHHNTPREWTEQEIAILEETAERMWASAERARAQQELRASETLYRTIARSIPGGGVYVVDKDLRYLVAEGPVTEAFQLTREMLEGRTVMEAFPDERGVRMEERLRRNLDGETLSYETSFNGRTFWTQQAPISDSIGQVIIVTIDITERKQAEQALRMAREQAEASADRIARLQEITSALAGSVTAQQLAEQILEQGTRASGASAGILVEVLDPGDQIQTLAALGYPEKAIRRDPVPLSDPTPVSDSIRSGQAIWIESQEEYAAQYPALAEFRRGLGNEAVVALPLIVGERVLGSLAFSFKGRHDFLLEERGFLLAVAQQCAQGLERVRATEALRESEQRFAGFMQHLPGLAWIKDVHGRYVFANDAAEQAFRTPRSKLYGHTDAEVFLPDVAEQFRSNDQRALSESKGIQVVEQLKHEDGTLHYSLVNKFPIFGGDGAATLIGGMAIDITESRRAQEALQASEERYRFIVESTSDGIWRIELEEPMPISLPEDEQVEWYYRHAVMRQCNLELARMYGYNSPEEVIGLPMRILMPPDQPMNMDLSRRFIRSNYRLVDAESHEKDRDGRDLIFLNNMIGIVQNGMLVGEWGTNRDITERKRAEDRLLLLTEVSEVTRDIDDPVKLMSAVADVVGRHLQVQRCLFNEIDVEKDLEVVHHDYHDGAESVQGIHRLADYSERTTAEMMSGNTVVNHDSKNDPRTAADYERSYVPHGERAYVAVPLMREEAWVASLWVSDNRPRTWSNEDVALLETVAERTWTAVEKLRIHAALRDSEERLRVTFNTTAVGFAMLTPDTRFVDVNQAYCDIVGYSRAELQTMNFDYLVHPDYFKSTHDHLSRLLQGEVPSFVIEKPYIRRDGTQVWVQSSGSLVRDRNGEPLHLIVISQDITERKQIESLEHMATANLLAAAEANAKFRTFFEQGSYFAGVMTLDGTLVESNRLSLEFCGFRREEVIGRKFWDCGWWSPSAELMEMVREGTRQAAEGVTFRRETNYYVADGSVRFVDLIIAPIRAEDGRILFLAPTGTDITERKQIEEELRQLNLQLEERVEKRTRELQAASQLRRMALVERRQAQDRFVKSFNASPAAMTITRFEDGMYRNVNPKFIELLEYKLEDVIGHTSLELNLYRDPSERADLLKSIRRNNGQWDYETHLETRTGKPLDVTISVVEIELDGEPHILSMIMDITERNQMLAALRASEQQLRTLFDVLPVGVSYVRHDGRVIQANRTLEKILDITREELDQGVHDSRQYIRADGTPMPESEFASTRALTEQRTVKNVEIGVIKEGGQVIWTSVSATPISMPEPGVVVITVDVTERKHMDDELRRSHNRYQILSQRLVEIQEEERRTISRELHDRVGQSLAALNLNLNFMNQSAPIYTPPQIKSRLKDAIQLTEETVSTIRDVMANLRPPALDDYGLEAALNAYADTFSRRFGIRVKLVKPNELLPRLNPNIELTLLRIAQEALTNVAKHSHASKATITLTLDEDAVYLSVEDNGEGIQSWQKANRPGSHGLKIMRERADTFGGSLHVHSMPQKGTKIEVKIPIQMNRPTKVRAEAD